MSGPVIRRAIAADAAPLARFKLATYRATFVDGGFAIPYPPADLVRFEAENYAPEVVAREIADPGRATWVAEADGEIVGYTHVGPCKLPHPDVAEGAGELYQFYVDERAQGTGLGRRLLDIALDHLAATRPGPLWVGVWSGNVRAQAIYAARGFVRVGSYLFPVGEWRDEEFIYRRG